MNQGIEVNDSNKIVADKPIGTDVTKEVSEGKVSTSDVIGKPNNTGKLPKPNTGVEEQPSMGGETKPKTPTNPEKPVEPAKPTNKDVFVTLNVDTEGNLLASTNRYIYVSESMDAGSIQVLSNGNTITTYTTTVVWKKSAPGEVAPVNPSDVGNSGILASTLSNAGAQGEAMHNDPDSAFYWAWFAVNEGSDDKVWAFKTAPIEMTDGSTWYTVVFYVDYV